jgi:hypothetical protein
MNPKKGEVLDLIGKDAFAKEQLLIYLDWLP